MFPPWIPAYVEYAWVGANSAYVCTKLNSIPYYDSAYLAWPYTTSLDTNTYAFEFSTNILRGEGKSGKEKWRKEGNENTEKAGERTRKAGRL